jgi:hypothetical protein
VKATVEETDNYVGGSATTSFVISPKALTITADSDTKVYDGTELTKNSYTATELATGDTIESVTITGSQTDAGESANVASDAVIEKDNVDVTSNYKITYADGKLTVTKADSTVSTDPEALKLTYTGKEQELVKAGQSEGGSLVYALATDDAEPAAAAYTAEIPKAIANGTYHIWYKAAADANYNETVVKSVDATISPVDKAELEIEIIFAKNVLDKIKDDAPKAAEELAKAITKAEEVAKDDKAIKATVDAEIIVLVIARIDALEAVPDRFSYVNTSGAGSVWNKTKPGLTFRFERTVNEKATFAHFVGIMVDGAAVEAKSYEAKIGSVIITLKPEYLETLAAGEHTLTVMFDDGDDVTVKFTIEEPLTPATGDENDMELWFILMAAAFVTAAMTKKKRRA